MSNTSRVELRITTLRQLRVPTSGLRRSGNSFRGLVSHVFLVVFVILTIYPIFFLFNVSAKSRFQFERNPLAIEAPEGLYAYVLA